MGFGVVLVFHFLAPSMPATCYSCRSALSILGSRFQSRQKAESRLSWSSESSKCFPNTQSAAGQTELVFQDPKHPETWDPDCRACCYWIRMRQRSTTWTNLHKSAWIERMKELSCLYIYIYTVMYCICLLSLVPRDSVKCKILEVHRVLFRCLHLGAKPTGRHLGGRRSRHSSVFWKAFLDSSERFLSSVHWGCKPGWARAHKARFSLRLVQIHKVQVQIASTGIFQTNAWFRHTSTQYKPV